MSARMATGKRARSLTSSVVLVIAACVVNDPVLDPPSQCRVVDRGKWRDAQLDQSRLLDPFCPVIVGAADGSEFQSYRVRITALDMNKLALAPGVRAVWFDAQGRRHPQPLLTYEQTQPFALNSVELIGQYPVGRGGEVNTVQADFIRVAVPLRTFPDSAKSEVEVTYRKRAPPTGQMDVSGAAPGVPVTFGIDARFEFRPVTYEYWIDGQSQPGETEDRIIRSFTETGTHQFTAKVTGARGHVTWLYGSVEIGCPNNEIIC